MTHWTEQQLAEIMEKRGHAGVMIRTDVSNPPFKLPNNPAGRYALGRLPTGTMNKTEAAYAAILAQRQHAGEILWHKFEGVKLRLADNTFYSPDFAVMLADGSMELHEVKGFMMDDANVKIKVAAATYPFRFIVVKARAKKYGGGWEMVEF